LNVGQDSDFTLEQFMVRYKQRAREQSRNLVNRTLNMTTRFAGGVLPAAEVAEDLEKPCTISGQDPREFIRSAKATSFTPPLSARWFS